MMPKESPRLIEEVCPSCCGPLSLTPEQHRGEEPVDCPEWGCGFNQSFDFAASAEGIGDNLSGV
jgi:hypothetical protein